MSATMALHDEIIDTLGPEMVTLRAKQPVYGFPSAHRVSKVLLIEKSGFFRAMFKHDWKEATSGYVTIEEDARSLQYFLNDLNNIFDIDPDDISVGAGREVFVYHWHSQCVRMYAMCDKYDVPRHKQAWKDRLSAMGEDPAIGFSGELDTIFHVLAYEDKPDWTEFLNDHYQTVTRAFGHYPEGLYPVFAVSLRAAIKRRDAVEEQLSDIFRSDSELATWVTLDAMRRIVMEEQLNELAANCSNYTDN